MRIDARTQETKGVAERASQAAVELSISSLRPCPPEASEGRSRKDKPGPS